jgi:putative glycerol-1-phosphate prenyltransferase
MTDQGIYQGLVQAKKQGEKRLAVLLDPDKYEASVLDRTLQAAQDTRVDYFLVGGSLLVHDTLDVVVERIRSQCSIPLILFPGNTFQLSHRADALLFLSLISGRNPELLIGQHVIAAPYLKRSSLEIISTGYMLIDGGVNSSVQYMSNTQPIPASKNDIAVSTALAGEMLGLRLLYLEAGSGAIHPVPESMIEAVSQAVLVPLVVGGGVRTPEKVAANFRAGADLVVVGTAFELDPGLIHEMAGARG